MNNQNHNHYNPNMNNNQQHQHNQPMYPGPGQNQYNNQGNVQVQPGMNQTPQSAPVYNTMPHIFPFHPIQVSCPNCHSNGQTVVRNELSAMGILVIVILLIFLLPITLCMLCCCYKCLTEPFTVSSHFCSKCRHKLGTTNVN